MSTKKDNLMIVYLNKYSVPKTVKYFICVYQKVDISTSAPPLAPAAVM